MRPCTGQGQIAHHIQHLVADEFIRMAQPAGVQDIWPIHHYGIGKAATQGEASLAQPFHILGQAKGARICQNGAKRVRGQAEGQGLMADSRIGVINIQHRIQGGFRIGAKLRKGALGVFHPDWPQHFNHLARHCAG